MEKKIKVVGSSCIVPFVITLILVATKLGLSFAILMAMAAFLAAYGVGVLLGKFPVPFIKITEEL